MTPLLVTFLATLPLSTAKIDNLQPKSISSVAVAAAVPEAQVGVVSVAVSAGGNCRNAGGRQLAKVFGYVDVTTLVETDSAAQDSAVTAMVRDGGIQIKRRSGCNSSQAPKPTI